MAKGYHHLTPELRCQIVALKDSGKSNHAIAKQLKRAPSTISRELRRNSVQSVYDAGKAGQMAAERRSAASGQPRKMTAERWGEVETKLALQWSPEQISGRLRLEGEFTVSHEWIYRRVWADKEAGGKLFHHLRHRGKKRNSRAKGQAGRGCIPGRVDISERPGIVEEKSRIGDWEGDTIVGARHQGAVLSLVDRASRFTLLALLGGRTAGETGEAIRRCLEPYKDFVHTITTDNGKEFAAHKAVAKALKASFFFAQPYHSWERGLNEHTNGLVRQYFPKATDFRKLDPAELERVETLLNNRPRKALDYRTPAEVFDRRLTGAE